MSKIPTIAMIPSGYKANKVYSVLPTNGDADLATTRASTATRVNQLGLIEEVATGVPRLDYSDGGCPNLLVEPQSTNLITYSEDFSNVAWSKLNGGTGSVPIVTTNQGISPKGDLTADRIQLDLNGGTTTSDVSGLQFVLTSVASQSYAASVWLKTNDGTTKTLRFNFSGQNPDVSPFDNPNIVVTPQWQRFTVVIDSAIDTLRYFTLRLRGGLGTSDTADVLIWGAQYEQQSYPTSYIPTSGSTATRVAETVSKTGLSNYINSSEGVLYFEVASFVKSGSFRILGLSDNTNQNRVIFYYFSNANTVSCEIDVLGVDQISGFTHTLTDVKTFNKFAIKYKENDFALWVNGVEVATDNSGSTFPSNTLNRLALDDGSGSGDFYGKIKDLRVYDQALTDAELQTLTS